MYSTQGIVQHVGNPKPQNLAETTVFISQTSKIGEVQHMYASQRLPTPAKKRSLQGIQVLQENFFIILHII